MARKIEGLGLSRKDNLNLTSQANLLLNLGISKEEAFASALGHLTGGDNWDAGFEARLNKPLNDDLNFEVTAFVRGEW